MDELDTYYKAHYACTEDDLQYLDKIENLIWDCVIDPNYAKRNPEKLLQAAKAVKLKMDALYVCDDGCTERQLLYQEKYHKLQVLYRKATGQDETAPLSMLCFASSLHLFLEAHSE